MTELKPPLGVGPGAPLVIVNRHALRLLAHSAELDYAGGDDLPELLPREAAQAPAPRGFARPGDLPSGGVV